MIQIDMSQNSSPKHDPEMEALANLFAGTGVSTDAVKHAPPKFIRRIPTKSLRESSKRSKLIASATFKLPASRPRVNAPLNPPVYHRTNTLHKRPGTRLLEAIRTRRRRGLRQGVKKHRPTVTGVKPKTRKSGRR